ncbi:glycosyltransferase family 4 protein [Alloalcanivorax gelatiniphagus]|uniref:Glycosyltransferase family 4 protein n=1 Tax=Alloalcanivorax gelatiniphagus TaxID=1194167 RepID=A0ABY2XMK8_9GAMM|nr:glycosyltransferase family 4 protein [Alloalcanivorax gelatiniphagus]TMW13606.1 glycosyltransferase family 4 protein [Alloalcanivorax gelatiniphagus]
MMVARLIGDKGVREYVAAAAQVAWRRPDVRFLLIGPQGVSNSSAIPPDEVARWREAGVVESLAACMQDGLALPRETLAAAGQAARRRIEAEFDERLVVRAALDCLEGARP